MPLLGACFLLLGSGFVEQASALPRAQSVAVPLPLAKIQDDSYILGPGDKLGLVVEGAPELSGQLEILNDGTAALPLLGSVRVTGLSLNQASAWFTVLFRRQLLNPLVQLRVTSPRPLRVVLIGEVERPGLYSLAAGGGEASAVQGAAMSISGLPTVVDAIQKAGGITQLANVQEVVLQRRLPGDQIRYKQAILDLWLLLKQGDQLQNPYLFDGDIIRIAKAAELPRDLLELSATNLSPQVISVNVLGQVLNPGIVDVPANLPLSQVVLRAGGLVPMKANGGNIQLLRMNRDGTASRTRYALNYGNDASNASNPPLRNGDTLLVGRSGFGVFTDGLDQIGSPLTSAVSLFGIFKLLQ